LRAQLAAAAAAAAAATAAAAAAASAYNGVLPAGASQAPVHVVVLLPPAEECEQLAVRQRILHERL